MFYLVFIVLIWLLGVVLSTLLMKIICKIKGVGWGLGKVELFLLTAFGPVLLFPFFLECVGLFFSRLVGCDSR